MSEINNDNRKKTIKFSILFLFNSICLVKQQIILIFLLYNIKIKCEDEREN
jgi:hypothetical protein